MWQFCMRFAPFVVFIISALVFPKLKWPAAQRCYYHMMRLSGNMGSPGANREKYKLIQAEV
jgi:hypothetical protein